MSDFRLSTFVHGFVCPHCQQQTQHTSPGGSILFASIKCEHCGKGMVIVQDKLWVREGSSGQPA